MLAFLPDLGQDQDMEQPIPTNHDQEWEAPSSRNDFRIPEQNMADLEARLAKLNAKAAKLGVAPITFTITGEEWVEQKKVDAFEQTVIIRKRFVLVHVEGEAPKLAGWTFAATLQHLDGQNILRTAPSFEASLPLQYRKASQGCDHCGTDRKRNDTYIVVNEAGEWKQIGRSCLKDFMGHANPLGVAAWAELICSLSGHLGDLEDERDGRSWQGREYFPTMDILQMVRNLILVKGYTSRKAALATDGIPTSQYLFKVAFERGRYADELRAEMKASREANEALIAAEAQAAQEWALSLPEGGSDFEWNLRTIAGLATLSSREFGLAVALVGAFLRARDEAKKAAAQTAQPSEWFGTKGKREVFTLTLISARELASDFGVTTMMIFQDPQGNKAKWFASGAVMANREKDLGATWEEGATYEVKATVKDHTSWKGQKETQLTRATRQKLIAPAPQAA